MPEQSEPPLRPQSLYPTGEVRSLEKDAVTYSELFCRSNFTFLEGASHPEELIERAATLGYSNLALTDECSVSGLVRAHVAAKELPTNLLSGSYFCLTDETKLVLLAEDRKGWGRLCRLITKGRQAAGKGKYRLTRDDINTFSEGLQAIAIRQQGSELDENTTQDLHWLKETFGKRASLAAIRTGQPREAVNFRRLQRVGLKLQIPLVATGAVLAHHSSRRALRDTLLAIKHRCQIKNLGQRLPPYLSTLTHRSHIARIFRNAPECIHRSTEIADQCTFRLDELIYTYPVDGWGIKELRRITMDGAVMRWPQGIPDKIKRLLAHELSLIEELNYEAYFLTVHDIVRFARSREILCQGRGSAANSAVCYCLGITAVNPDQFELLFERFISKERGEPPDIDVDFEHERREEVIQYIYERYGRERSAMTGSVITYRPRSALRDAGGALGLSVDLTERLSRAAKEHRTLPGAEGEFLQQEGFDANDPDLKRTLHIAEAIQGFPRHLSQHTGGMVITQHRLDELCPIENAAMDRRTVLQWDKNDLDALGILKVDCLALGMLTAIRRALDLLREVSGLDLTLATIPTDEPEIYEMASRADTVGTFQIESRAQMAMLPRFQPKCFYDLVIEIALVRPGPIQGGMVHPYLRRRAGKEAVTYPSDAVKEVLRRTLGVPIFQEQVMKLAVVAAGFTPGEADQLRRCMAAWRRPGQIEQFREKLISGLLKRGYQQSFAEALFKQIQGFGEYGFPESHAASFAYLTYVSCWLKCFHPAAFCAALLNSQPLGFYSPGQLIADAKRHGVIVREIDVTKSEWQSTLERCENGEPAIRLGLHQIGGLKQADVSRLLTARNAQAFISIHDLRLRSNLTSATTTLLADAGALSTLRANRRRARWESGADTYTPPLWGGAASDDFVPELTPPSLIETVEADITRTGFSLTAHPMSLIRKQLLRNGVDSPNALHSKKHGDRVRVAGVVICRQRPATASGILFITLEDEVGFINLVVRKKEQASLRLPLFRSAILMVGGRLEKLEGTAHVLVQEAWQIEIPQDIAPTGRRSRIGR